MRNIANCRQTQPKTVMRLMSVSLRKALLPAQSVQVMSRIRVSTRFIRVLPSGLENQGSVTREAVVIWPLPQMTMHDPLSGVERSRDAATIRCLPAGSGN